MEKSRSSPAPRRASDDATAELLDERGARVVDVRAARRGTVTIEATWPIRDAIERLFAETESRFGTATS